MDVKQHNHHFSRSRRGFVQASAYAALGLTALAKESAEASSANRGDNDMALSLQEISDRLEIEELLVRYCYAVDDRDWEAYRNVFAPNAVLDDTVTGGIRSDVERTCCFHEKSTVEDPDLAARHLDDTS